MTILKKNRNTKTYKMTKIQTITGADPGFQVGGGGGGGGCAPSEGSERKYLGYFV